MANTSVILLQRVENLGQMGDVVTVKPGYARNFLLPQKKALRATKDNVAYFEGQKKQLEAVNLKLKAEAEKVAAKAKYLFVNIIRQAAEGGQLYGSVSTRDIAEAVTSAGFTVDRAQIVINQSFKTIGLFAVDVLFHPEVKVVATINIARSEEEAKVQKKTGKAMVAGREEEAAAPVAVNKAALMDEAALAAETEAEAQARIAADTEAKVQAEKSAKRAAKKATKKVEGDTSEGDASDETADDAE